MRTEMGQDTEVETEMGQGHKDGTEHLGRDTGKSTETGPQRWDRVQEQGH